MITQADRQVKLMDFGLVQDSQGLLQLYEQVDILDASDDKLALSVAQYQALGTVALTAADTVTLLSEASRTWLRQNE